MNLRIQIGPRRAEPRCTLARALVHLPESNQAEPLIRFATELAQRCGAHLRGLTLIDTYSVNDLVSTCEAGAYAIHELERLESGTGRRNAVRTYFSNACLQAGLDFDLHIQQGETLEVLAQEARFHDLLITAVSTHSSVLPGDWAPADVVDLILNRAAPVLALNGRDYLPDRILMIQDGTQAASSAIRSFLTQGLFPHATFRLLAVSPDAREAEAFLRESVDYVRARVSHLETGYVLGPPAQVVPEFIHQWEADLVVLGGQRRAPVLKWFCGETVQQVLRRTNCSLYATS